MTLTREIERAWAAHDSSRRRDRIGAEQRGLLRVFKQGLAAPAAKIEAAIHSPVRRQAAADYTYKKGKGRARALERLNRLLAPAVVVATIEEAPASIWAWLRAGGPVLENSDDPGHSQDCVLVLYAVMGRSVDGCSMSGGAWSLEMPDHALARLLQHHRGIDLGKAIWEAHDTLMKSSITEFTDCVMGNRTIYLPCAGGAFACEPIGVRSHGVRLVYTRARTWLSDLFDDQHPIAPARDEADMMVMSIFDRLNMSDDDAAE